jgi:glutaminase
MGGNVMLRRLVQTRIVVALLVATLANNGKEPATSGQVFKSENVSHILSTMNMAGLYDEPDGLAWQGSLPAKSVVGGDIVAVVPGKGAIAVFGPPLDEAGTA